MLDCWLIEVGDAAICSVRDDDEAGHQVLNSLLLYMVENLRCIE